MHNALPHEHSIASFSDQSAVSNHHHDSQGWHDHDSDSKGLFGFISELFGGFDHQDIGLDHFEWYVGNDVGPQFASQDIFKVVILPAEFSLSISKAVIPKDNYGNAPPVVYRKPNLDIAPLRGPPSIS